MTRCVILVAGAKKKIRSSKDKRAETIYSGEYVRKMDKSLQDAIRKKLRMLSAAVVPEDLRLPPGNHFEALEGRNGYYSIRTNNQWRLTFSWNEGAEDVAIEDYH